MSRREPADSAARAERAPRARICGSSFATLTASLAAAIALPLAFAGCTALEVHASRPATVSVLASVDYAPLLRCLAAWLGARDLPDFTLDPAESPRALGLVK